MGIQHRASTFWSSLRFWRCSKEDTPTWDNGRQQTAVVLLTHHCVYSGARVFRNTLTTCTCLWLDGISINVTSNKRRVVFHTYLACQVSVNTAFILVSLNRGPYRNDAEGLLDCCFLTLVIRHGGRVVTNLHLFDWHILFSQVKLKGLKPKLWVCPVWVFCSGQHYINK